ncbi:glyoxalase [Brochothrix thermosphacta]|uniref:VOC family protein n=1 Tax=Brochothrix thermosphacta TaxID=2756 RepID=UPI000E745FE5|nr:VOC family protein [Brochothrix thermosphacta]ANZ95342.1 glyoxalase [Brochothrix thermosphacta]
MKLDMVGIIVKDMKASLAFYRALGFSFPDNAEKEAYVEVDQGGVRLSFNTEEMVTPLFGELEKPKGQRIELAFLCENVQELDRLYDNVIAKGYQGVREPWDAFWGQRYCILENVDGNLISLFVPLE